jgi:hypothetical protein
VAKQSTATNRLKHKLLGQTGSHGSALHDGSISEGIKPSGLVYIGAYQQKVCLALLNADMMLIHNTTTAAVLSNSHACSKLVETTLGEYACLASMTIHQKPRNFSSRHEHLASTKVAYHETNMMLDWYNMNATLSYRKLSCASCLNFTASKRESARFEISEPKPKRHADTDRNK